MCHSFLEVNLWSQGQFLCFEEMSIFLKFLITISDCIRESWCFNTNSLHYNPNIIQHFTCAKGDLKLHLEVTPNTSNQLPSF